MEKPIEKSRENETLRDRFLSNEEGKKNMNPQQNP